MADVFETINTRLLRGDGAASEVFTDVPGIRAMGTVGASRSLIDVTHLQSTAREYKLALKDGQEMTFEALYDPSDTQQTGLKTDLNNGTRRNFQIHLNDDQSPNTIVSFTGLVTAWNFEVQLDNVYVLNFTLKPTGDLAWSP